MVVMKGTEGMRKVVAVSKIEIALNIAAILNLKWTFGSTGDSGGPIDQHPVRGEADLMEAGASTPIHTQMLLDYTGAVGTVTAICLDERAPNPHPEYNAALNPVEPEDLTRFEGEGGPCRREMQSAMSRSEHVGKSHG